MWVWEPEGAVASESSLENLPEWTLSKLSFVYK